MNEIQLKYNIIKLRKERNLTQKQLAEKINYSDKVISKWECGESYPDINALKQLSDFFNVSIDEIVGNENQKEKDNSQSTFKLDVVRTEKPSFIARTWIIIPLIFLIFTIPFGPEIFFLALALFGLLLIIYGFTTTKYSFETVYQGKFIKIINRTKKLELYIDNQLVDGVYSIFKLNPELNGKIDDKNLRVKISNLTSIKCHIFIG